MLQGVHHHPCAQECLPSWYERLPSRSTDHGGYEMLWEVGERPHLLLSSKHLRPTAVRLLLQQIQRGRHIPGLALHPLPPWHHRRGLLFIDYTSAFNTVVPSRLATKLHDLGLNPSMCAWILDFLTARPQVVRVGGHTSHTLILSTGVPQGCVLSPLLYSLYTHDCAARHNSNTIVKFADDMVVVVTMTNGPTYRRCQTWQRGARITAYC